MPRTKKTKLKDDSEAPVAGTSELSQVDNGAASSQEATPDDVSGIANADATASVDRPDQGEVVAIEALAGEVVADTVDVGGEVYEAVSEQDKGENADEEELATENAEITIIAANTEHATDTGEELQALTAEERQRFMALDREVEESFLAAARALREISEQKLYREAYATFEDYIASRFDFTKRLAYYYIDAAKIADNLLDCEPMVHILPTSERQLRPLKNLSPEEQRKIWRRSVEKADGMTPSGALVRETKEEILGPQKGVERRLPQLQAGDICVIRGSSDELLKERIGYWAVVNEVRADGLANLTLYDGTVNGVFLRNLSRIESSGEEKTAWMNLLDHLAALNDWLDLGDRAINLLFHHFGTLKEPHLTSAEERILHLLDRIAQSVEE
jgi:hypothetical protein